MPQSDRERLLARALALPQASYDDFHGERTPPRNVDPTLLKRIDDTALRTKLVDAGLAEGLQSPKGPQKIASIVRIYPAFDAPPRSRTNGRTKIRRNGSSATIGQRALKRPRVDELERLLVRYRQVEHDVAGRLGAQLDEQIGRLKRALSELDGDALESAVHDLGAALDSKRALDARIAEETFAHLESDSDLPERSYLHLLAR